MTDYYVIARKLECHSPDGEPFTVVEYATNYHSPNLHEYAWDDDVCQAVGFSFMEGSKRIKALNDKYGKDFDWRFYLARPQIYSFDEIR